MNDPQFFAKIAFGVVLLKYTLGGFPIFGHIFPTMAGSDFAMSLAACGAVHTAADHISNLAKKLTDDK